MFSCFSVSSKNIFFSNKKAKGSHLRLLVNGQTKVMFNDFSCIYIYEEKEEEKEKLGKPLTYLNMYPKVSRNREYMKNL